jgi:hypothetical protein
MPALVSTSRTYLRALPAACLLLGITSGLAHVACIVCPYVVAGPREVL